MLKKKRRKKKVPRTRVLGIVRPIIGVVIKVHYKLSVRRYMLAGTARPRNGTRKDATQSTNAEQFGICMPYQTIGYACGGHYFWTWPGKV